MENIAIHDSPKDSYKPLAAGGPLVLWMVHEEAMVDLRGSNVTIKHNYSGGVIDYGFNVLHVLVLLSALPHGCVIHNHDERHSVIPITCVDVLLCPVLGYCRGHPFLSVVVRCTLEEGPSRDASYTDNSKSCASVGTSGN